jgi:hypothetical protein
MSSPSAASSTARAPARSCISTASTWNNRCPNARRGNVGHHVLHPDRRPRPLGAHRQSHRRPEFANSTAQTKTESEQAFTVGFLALLGNVKMFLIGISAAVMFTILLVSANTMAMSVRERVREVGVLKTLGFTPAAFWA